MDMSRMIQIRNVPEALHRKLKAKAARLGMTLSGYLLSEIRPLADLPTVEELVERVMSRPALELDEGGGETIRRIRGQI